MGVRTAGDDLLDDVLRSDLEISLCFLKDAVAPGEGDSTLCCADLIPLFARAVSLLELEGRGAKAADLLDGAVLVFSLVFGVTVSTLNFLGSTGSIPIDMGAARGLLLAVFAVGMVRKTYKNSFEQASGRTSQRRNKRTPEMCWRERQ